MIKAKVEAREISDTIKVHEVRHSNIPRRNVRPTASTLMMQEYNPGGRECVYCKGEHYSASCETITGVPARKEALKKEGRCLVCLARGHCAAQCRSSKRCRKCSHRHHQSLCEIDNSAQNSEGTSPQGMLTAQNPGGTSPSQPQTTLTTATRSKTRVLLQTTQSFAFSVGNSTVPVWILFDNGSQRSYITEIKGEIDCI